MPESGLRTPAELRLEEWVRPVFEEFAIADGEYVADHGTSPEEALVLASESARLVVIGRSNRHAELAKMLLGSVSTALITRSSCPVAIVHDGRWNPVTDQGGVVDDAEMGRSALWLQATDSSAGHREA